MFTWLGTQIDTVLAGYVTAAVAGVMSYLGPLALAAMTLWVTLYGLAVMRGEVSEPVTTFAWKMVKNALIVGLATSGGLYQANVVDGANGLMTGLVASFAPAGSALASPDSVWSVLDAFNDQASRLVTEVLKEGVLSLDALVGIFAGVIFSIGNTVFEVVALYVVVVAKVLMSFVLAVGPIFILGLLFKQTAQFFFSWLGLLSNMIVLVWLVFFVLGFSLFMSERIVAAALAQLGSLNLIGESLRYLVICLVLALLLYQAPNFAAALTGGSPAQLGAQMVSQAALSWRAVHGQPVASANQMQRGRGLAYQAGRAVGQMGQAGQAGLRRAAYRIAALRGRQGP
ncbi:MAG: hypothetical protein RLY71_1826 [Pseudomonadota bacterium]|jgi:type IV secretion system protein VirB6